MVRSPSAVVSTTLDFLIRLGFEAVGVDISESGIAQANAAYPRVRADVGSAYDDLAPQYGTFSLVVSLKVIEHCKDPRTFARTFLSLIALGCVGFLSTPYHAIGKTWLLRSLEN
jgi:2-polyprenyl-6-hydroxyphenyl methylase/3-demethylubiquinone-9 3-methyltransferase